MSRFGLLILEKIIKAFAIRFHILKLQCTKTDFVWGSDPYGKDYSAPPDSELDRTGPNSKSREGRVRGATGRGKGRVRRK